MEISGKNILLFDVSNTEGEPRRFWHALFGGGVRP